MCAMLFDARTIASNLPVQMRGVVQQRSAGLLRQQHHRQQLHNSGNHGQFPLLDCCCHGAAIAVRQARLVTLETGATVPRSPILKNKSAEKRLFAGDQHHCGPLVHSSG